MCIHLPCERQDEIFEVAVVGSANNEVAAGTQQAERILGELARLVNVLDDFRADDGVEAVGWKGARYKVFLHVAAPEINTRKSLLGDFDSGCGQIDAANFVASFREFVGNVAVTTAKVEHVSAWGEVFDQLLDGT